MGIQDEAGPIALSLRSDSIKLAQSISFTFTPDKRAAILFQHLGLCGPDVIKSDWTQVPECSVRTGLSAIQAQVKVLTDCCLEVLVLIQARAFAFVEPYGPKLRDSVALECTQEGFLPQVNDMRFTWLLAQELSDSFLLLQHH